MMHIIHITIETPKGSIEKYSYDPESQGFRLKKILPLGMMFPYDFGFIPQTQGEDGDPLDALVISEFKTFPGCSVECRLIGALLAEQTAGKEKIRNDRYFFIPQLSTIYQHVTSLSQLPGQHLRQLQDFFITYNREQGKLFKPIEYIGSAKAYKILKKQGDALFVD
jgi:inorganic pyrophosphatase